MVVLTLGVLLAVSASAQDLVGVVRSAAGKRPVSGAVVRFEDGDLTVVTDENGRFSLPAVYRAVADLRVEHPEFLTWEGRIDLAEQPVEIELASIEYELEEVVVTADGGSREFIDAEPSASLAGPELNLRLAGTLAATMEDLPGVAQRSMGAATARPVVRGLDGNRLLVLEDGTSTGDLSASSPDHAVIVEPLLTQKIALVRGPAAIQYGSNVIGGAIDVGRGALPEDDILDWGVQAGTQLESVNDGVAGQVGIVGREGSFVLKGDAVVRRTGDLRTPAGTLGNTSSDGWDVGAGAAWVGEQVSLSAAAGRVEAGYGIPGGFKGGHPNGVDIELERTRYDGRLRWEGVGAGIERVEALGSYKRYYHEEIESSGICGVAFGLLTYDAVVRARVAEGGILGGTAFGISAQYRDLATACLSFLPQTGERSFGGFAHQKRELGRFDLEAALRWDRRVVTPAAPDSNKTGVVRERDFDGFSGSVAGGWRIDDHHRLRGIATRTFQPPAIEELFSEGPHLAAYSYDIGNADLAAERSWGGELEYRMDAARVYLAAAVFHYDIDNYIFASDTGELEFGPGEEGFLSLYQYTGRDARLRGGEISAGLRFDETWSLDGTASFVRGDLTGEDAGPLPRIPPLAGHLEAARQGDRTRFTVTARGATRQDRVAEFEDPTAAWVTFDAGFEWVIAGESWHHAFVLRGHNLLDAEYRNHLSRIKSIMPEAGRGVSLLYRVYR